MGYLPIGDYGVIGDLHTVALVGSNGSIDWWCHPNFDSPSIFAAILDEEKGGRFQIRPVVDCNRKQLYLPDTNVLITRFLSSEGVAEITDFMPIRHRAATEFEHKIVRRVEAVSGRVRFHLVCHPAFDYARTSHTVEIVPHGAVFTAGDQRICLVTSAPIALVQHGDSVQAAFELLHGEHAWFELYAPKNAEPEVRSSDSELSAAFLNTVNYWRRWLSSGTYKGRWREMVNRSALALKLLTFQPTGAIVSAPTTSLPEKVGGVRNWDYRYAWIRDASFTLYGLLRVGFTEEAEQFMGWVNARLHEPSPDVLSIVYSIHGSKEIEESHLDHLAGYLGSKPVRIGNGAVGQRQLDIYGELMDSVYLYNKYVTPIGYDMWSRLRPLVDWVTINWQLPDEGIWEVRGGRRNFVYSKVMCWVAVDRALRLAEKRSFPAPRSRWIKVRDAIYEDVMKRGWSERRQSFVQSYEEEVLDASALLMPLVFFMSPTDPRMLSTIDAISKELVSDSLVHRYLPAIANDGLPGAEGTFSLCTFWLVEAMTRAGRVDEARLIFEKMLTYANHLGLYSEEIGPTGEQLGNFPQGFTHLALISAAYNLDLALDKRKHRAPSTERR